jgi:hypothetical protein
MVADVEESKQGLKKRCLSHGRMGWEKTLV